MKPEERAVKITGFSRLWIALSIFTMIVTLSNTIPVYAASQYTHDPMSNPKAAQDIVVNENAVYGYSPNPSSTRLGEFASYDWTDPKMVEDARQDRIEYHQKNEELYQMIRTMAAAGKSTEDIARAVSARRNEIRLEAYKDDPVGLEKVKKSNLDTYGHEEGPTPDDMYKKYGSWQTVIDKALSSNPGMDACLGLYDLYYDTYGISDSAEAAESNVINEGTYVVRRGDCLWSIAKSKLHNGSRWTEIYELNKEIITNKDMLYPGQQLLLPAQ